MKLHTIDTGYFKLDGGAMFGVVPKSIWKKLNPPDTKNLCTWAMRCLLIEDGQRLILIDTGIGNKQSAKFLSHFQPHGDDSLFKSLDKLGFAPDDITDVLLTHLHFDHCGGAVSKQSDGSLKTTFPQATYWSHRQHWEWAVAPNAREKASFLKENFLPIKESGQLQFANEQSSIHPNIELRVVNGHTEAMFIPIIHTDKQSVAYMADLIPSAAHIALPYVMAYDVRPLDTLQEKAAFLTEAYEKNYLLFFEHDRATECCKLRNTDRGVRLEQGFRLAEIM